MGSGDLTFRKPEKIKINTLNRLPVKKKKQPRSRGFRVTEF